MKTAIILHGMPPKEEYFDSSAPSPSNNHWLPWIQRQLLLQNILAQTLELPVPYAPVYEDWKYFFERLRIDENTILVGHSCGAGFLIRYLSENDCRAGKVALVAPWTDPRRTLPSHFFDFNIDKNILSKTSEMCIFNSLDDMDDVKESVKIFISEVPSVEVKNFTSHGHFTLGDMKTEKFPELLDFLLK